MKDNSGEWRQLHEIPPRKPVQTSRRTECRIRTDDSGTWNTVKAWHIFFAHIAASVLITVAVTRVDGSHFRIGSGPSILSFQSRLYQVQVTGLLSLALVALRIVVGSSSALLAWRIIFILLEKRGISLGELTRLTNWRVPILPGIRSRTSVLWSVWATTTVLLLWPAGCAAPLASSSISWIPGSILAEKQSPIPISHVERHTDWRSLLYDEMRHTVVVDGASMISKDPTYAFHPAKFPLRRYFNTTADTPSGSKMDISVPYFAVALNWIDSSSNNRSKYAGYSKYSDVNPGFGIRIPGTTSLVRSEPWNPYDAMPDEPVSVAGKALISVKLRTQEFGDELPDGSIITNETECIGVSNDFIELPPVAQQQISIVRGDETVAYDCHLLAEATITAGVYQGKGCVVTSSNTTSDGYATCSVDRDDSAAEPDWLAGLALDFTSETLKYSTMQNYSQPWISHNLDDYVSGMLTLGYHAAWSGLNKKLGNATESVPFWAAEPIVFASIDRWKLYVFLGMNASLTTSAILVMIAASFSGTKTIRDTTIAVLTVDLSEVAHGSGAEGLCNAVGLNKSDSRLPRLRWKGAGTSARGNGTSGSCVRRVVFAKDFRSVKGPSYDRLGSQYAPGA